MPQGMMRRLQRIIAGLLVLAVLLFAGAQASIAALAGTCGHHADGAGQIVAMIDYGAATPVHHDESDHALPCCIDGQCSTCAYWVSATRAPLPPLSHLGPASASDRDRLLAGVVTEPSSPPPRAAV